MKITTCSRELLRDLEGVGRGFSDSFFGVLCNGDIIVGSTTTYVRLRRVIDHYIG
jgi:hypothetical protein